MEHQFVSLSTKIVLQHTFSLEALEFYLTNYNAFNRPLGIGNLERLKRAILARDYESDIGDPVRFASDLHLLDGGHRFQAHLDLGVPLVADVYYGLDRTKAAKYLDGGAPKTMGVRCLLVQKVPCTVTAKKRQEAMLAIANCWNWQASGFTKYTKLSVTDAQAFISQHFHALEFVLTSTVNRNMKRAPFRAAMAQYYEKDPVKAKLLFSLVSSGVNIPAGSAALRLSQFLRELRLSQFLRECDTGSGVAQKEEYTGVLYLINRFQQDLQTTQIGYLDNWQF